MAPMFRITQGLSNREPSRTATNTLVSREFMSRVIPDTHKLIHVRTNGDLHFRDVANALRGTPRTTGEFWGLYILGQSINGGQLRTELEVNSLLDILQIYPTVKSVELCNVDLVPSEHLQGFPNPRSLQTLFLKDVTIARRRLQGPVSSSDHSGLFQALKSFENINELVVAAGCREAPSTAQVQDINLLEIATRGVGFLCPRIKNVIIERIESPRLFYAVLQRFWAVEHLTSLRLTISDIRQPVLLYRLLSAASRVEDLAVDISPCHEMVCAGGFTGAPVARPLGHCFPSNLKIKRICISIQASTPAEGPSPNLNILSWDCMVAILWSLGPEVETIAIEFVHSCMHQVEGLLPFFRQQNWQRLRQVLKDRMDSGKLRLVNFSRCDRSGACDKNNLTAAEDGYVLAQLQLPIVVFAGDAKLISGL